MNCRVCGRQFDPQGFQVMVPGLLHGFDRVDCALEAHALGLPPSRHAEPAEPAPAVMRALPTPLAAVPAFAGGPAVTMRAESVRPQFLDGVNLALLAAGTAATIYLWLRVFGADAGPIPFPAANASDAFARSTVAAAIDLSPPEARPQAESAVRGGGSQPATSPPTSAGAGDGGTLVSNRKPAKPEPSSRTGGGPVVRPTAPPPAPAPPPEPGPARSAPVPTYPVPSTPPADRVPGPTLPGGSNPEQPALPGSGTRG